jgi:hypothetical protein
MKLRLIAYPAVLAGLFVCHAATAQSNENCSDALVRATYNRIASSSSDWRIARHVSEKDYDEIKKSAGLSAVIYGVPIDASYDDFQKRIREKTDRYNESLTQSQLTNILWTGLDPNSGSLYTECIKSRIFSQRGLRLAVRSATASEVAIWISWSPRGDDKNPRPEWSFSGDGIDRMPKLLAAGERIVVLPRPKEQKTLAVNFKGYADSLIIEPFPIANPTVREVAYVETTETYDSEEITGWGTNFSAPNVLCTPEKPKGWTIVKVTHFLKSARERGSCGSWTTCTGSETDSGTRACRAVTVQGHTDNKFSGYGTATSHLQVTWKRPVP